MEVLRKVKAAGTQLFLKVKIAWTKERIQTEWAIAPVLLTYKKGDNEQCNNCRDISTFSTPLKVYENIYGEWTVQER